jgi:hypothetical protein
VERGIAIVIGILVWGGGERREEEGELLEGIL